MNISLEGNSFLVYNSIYGQSLSSKKPLFSLISYSDHNIEILYLFFKKECKKMNDYIGYIDIKHPICCVQDEETTLQQCDQCENGIVESEKYSESRCKNIRCDKLLCQDCLNWYDDFCETCFDLD